VFCISFNLNNAGCFLFAMRLSALFRGDQAVLRGNFLLITLSWIILFIAQPIPDTYASLFYIHLGADAFLLSIIGFAGSIAVALVQFPGGYLADKHGRRWLIVSMTFGLAVGSLFFIFAPSWQFILIGLLVQNVCSIYGPALMAMVIDSLPSQNRGAGFSLQSVITVCSRYASFCKRRLQQAFAGVLFLWLGQPIAA